jgi:hypothetical protein
LFILFLVVLHCFRAKILAFEPRRRFGANRFCARSVRSMRVCLVLAFSPLACLDASHTFFSRLLCALLSFCGVRSDNLAEPWFGTVYGCPSLSCRVVASAKGLACLPCIPLVLWRLISPAHPSVSRPLSQHSGKTRRCSPQPRREGAPGKPSCLGKPTLCAKPPLE